MRKLVALAAGFVFGAGLLLARATDPATVLGFLDPLGSWDPSLFFMFVAAAATHALLLRLVATRPAPLLADRFDAPAARALDLRLVLGATLFGVGWGLAGICPGPALTALGTGSAEAALFTAAMIGGMVLHDRVPWRARRARAAPAPRPS